MKFLVLVAVISKLVTGVPQGTKGSIASPKPASPAAQTVSLEKGKTTTPPGCRKLSSDVDWPMRAEWRKALPEVSARSKTLAAGVYRPDYKVRAENYGDVQAAVKFAAKNNIRLTVINSGHDFLGRNDAPSGLSLDTSLLGGIQVHESFVPSEAGAAKPGAANIIVPAPGNQAAVTFGVGITTQVLNNALHPSKLLTIGAAHGSVAPAGGYGQTAGHGPLTNRYGLGADQFLEFKVVTADGNLVVANKVSNPDLFWALRGGGGGTFGVVVEATMKAHPDIPITMATWDFNTTQPDSDGIWQAYSYLHTQMVDLVEKYGISGYYYIYPSSMKGIMLHHADHSGRANAERIWNPILAKMGSYPNMTKAKLEISEFNSYKAYFDARFGPIDQGKQPPKTMPWETHSRRSMLEPRHGPGMEMTEPVPSAIANLDSRLLGAEHFKHPNLTAYFKAASPWVLGANQSVVQGHLVGGGKVFHPDDDTSVLPAWRQAYSHVIGYKVPGKASLDSLRVLAPESGAYANEAYPLEENWKQSFWGSNYNKLSQIKSKYDPDMIFWITPGINADHMEARDGRVCKVARIATTLNTGRAPLSDNLNNGRIMSGSINNM